MNPMIVAEIGANHNGSLIRALQLVGAAVAAGADAVKIQTFTPEQMADPDTALTTGPWRGRKLLELYRETHTPREWIPEIFATAQAVGIEAFSSVFHRDDVAFLETLNCPRYKIASFELTDRALIWAAARTGKPIILSLGMADCTEIYDAVLDVGNATVVRDLTLLKCTSAYPAAPEDANLAVLLDLRRRFVDIKVGISDHTQGIGVAVAAVALGASMVEKHLTLRRSDGGPDAAFSMEPEEFAQLVVECRRAAAAIGTVTYGPSPSEAASLPLRRRSGGKRGLTLTP